MQQTYYDSTGVGFHSRSIDDLDPIIKDKASKFMLECRKDGFDILIYCTYRDEWEQAKLYRNGRFLLAIDQKALALEKKGYPNLAHILRITPPQSSGESILTNAAPGESAHQYGVAFDFVPILNSKPMWGYLTYKEKDIWTRAEKISNIIGLESLSWERPHLQSPGFNNNRDKFMEDRYKEFANHLPELGQNPRWQVK